MSSARFPDGFLWGTGASAYQVEGAWDADGKGPSIWDVAAHSTSTLRPADGTSGDVAIDQYHRLDEDLDLLAQLGAPVHRFSISWPRVLPDGRRVNTLGLDYYEKMVDGLLARGIQPVANLFHWDLPQALEDEGGWLSRDTAQRFAQYAQIVADRLGDRVTGWFTMNEPTHPSLGGYVAGLLPPLRRADSAGLASVHHILLAHGLATQALQAQVASPVGIILSVSGVKAATDHPDDVAATQLAARFVDGLFLDPLLRGHHIEVLAAALGDCVREGDLAVIGTKMQHLGINWYSRYAIAAPQRASEHIAQAPPQWQLFATLANQCAPLGFVIVPEPGARWSFAHRQITPGGLGEVLRWIAASYPNHPPLIVSENGIGLQDLPGPDGRVDDQERIDFLSFNIADVADVIDDGIDVRGFWVWSAWDNLQWHAGFSQRFGLVHVAQPSLRRTPKASFDWFAELVGLNALPRVERG